MRGIVIHFLYFAVALLVLALFLLLGPEVPSCEVRS
jgi:hypothetical protein